VFGNIGWGELVILLIAALVILGPDRLPGAITWVTKSIRQVKEYANGASQQLKDELGTDFEDLRKPLDGDDSIFTGNFDTKKTNAGGPTPQKPSSPNLSTQKPSLEKKLPANQTPPIDSDAT
jgi:sec-independent protein translocase protein TatB